MFLQGLRLSNLRSIGELQLSFGAAGGKNRPWTYILGENGTGKSSVLKAIALVMAGGEALYELVGEPDDWIRLGADSASIEVEFATQDGEPRRAALEFRRGEKVVDFVERNRRSLEQLDSAVERSGRNYFVVGYGVTRKPAADERSAFLYSGSRFRSPRARAAATLFSSEASLVSLEQWAMDLEYRRGPEGLQAVRSALDTLLPDVEFGRIDRERRRLMFTTLDGELPLSALSDGYQAMAAWCGDLLWQITETFQDYRDPLKARGLLLVDELDLHLHPVWQRRLVAFLKQTLPNVQVVATTHSPLTVHQAGEGELFVLRREAGRVVTRQYEGAPNRLMLHQLLQSPLFGLETLDSPQVEALRDELRDLQKIGQDGEPSVAAEAQMKSVQRRLSDVPDWRQTQPYLRRTNDVLERIANELAGGDGDGDGDPVKAVAARASRTRTPR
jgi:predicted ATPase